MTYFYAAAYKGTARIPALDCAHHHRTPRLAHRCALAFRGALKYRVRAVDTLGDRPLWDEEAERAVADETSEDTR